MTMNIVNVEFTLRRWPRMLKRNKGSQANNGCVEGCWEKWGRHWGTLKQGKGIWWGTP
jgi:hypothetical protein